MAYTPTIPETGYASLTREDVLPALIASSPFLMHQRGVESSVAKGLSIETPYLVPPTAVPYTGAAITVADADAEAPSIKVDQGNAWATLVKKVDQDRSAISDMATKYGDLGMETIAALIDTYIASQGATTTNTGTTQAISDATVEGTIEEGVQYFLDNHMKATDIRIYVPSYVYTSMARAQGRVTASNEDAFRVGEVLPFMGAKIIHANTLANGVGANSKDIIFSTDWALQYAIGSIESELLKAPAGQFGTVSQGYAVYGADILKEQAIFKTEVTKA